MAFLTEVEKLIEDGNFEGLQRANVLSEYCEAVRKLAEELYLRRRDYMSGSNTEIMDAVLKEAEEFYSRFKVWQDEKTKLLLENS